MVSEREKRRIACEISVTSTVELELGNLKKCLAAGFTEIVMVCDEERTRKGLKREAEKMVTAGPLKGVRFSSPDEMFADAGFLTEELVPEEQIVRGAQSERAPGGAECGGDGSQAAGDCGGVGEGEVGTPLRLLSTCSHPRTQQYSINHSCWLREFRFISRRVGMAIPDGRM